MAVNQFLHDESFGTLGAYADKTIGPNFPLSLFRFFKKHAGGFSIERNLHAFFNG